MCISPKIIWATYGTALFLTGLSILLGLILYIEDGEHRNRDMSDIIAADRRRETGLHEPEARSGQQGTPARQPADGGTPLLHVLPEARPG
jgi:hypothetical protein